MKSKILIGKDDYGSQEFEGQSLHPHFDNNWNELK